MDSQILKLAMGNPNCPPDIKTAIQDELFQQAYTELDRCTDVETKKSMCNKCLASIGIDKSIYLIGKLYGDDKYMPIDKKRQETISKIAKTAAAEIYIILGGV